MHFRSMVATKLSKAGMKQWEAETAHGFQEKREQPLILLQPATNRGTDGRANLKSIFFIKRKGEKYQGCSCAVWKGSWVTHVHPRSFQQIPTEVGFLSDEFRRRSSHGSATTRGKLQSMRAKRWESPSLKATLVREHPSFQPSKT